MIRQLSDSELMALPERSALADNVVIVTDPETGVTHCERKPRRFVVNTCDIYGFRDRDGICWTVGEDEDGYFKSRVF